MASKFTRYADITDEQKAKIAAGFEDYKQMNPRGDAGHAAACIAHSVFQLTDRQWNSKVGSDAFAAVLGVMAMNKMLDLRLV